VSDWTLKKGRGGDAGGKIGEASVPHLMGACQICAWSFMCTFPVCKKVMISGRRHTLLFVFLQTLTELSVAVVEFIKCYSQLY